MKPEHVPAPRLRYDIAGEKVVWVHELQRRLGALACVLGIEMRALRDGHDEFRGERCDSLDTLTRLVHAKAPELLPHTTHARRVYAVQQARGMLIKAGLVSSGEWRAKGSQRVVHYLRPGPKAFWYAIYGVLCRNVMRVPEDTLAWLEEAPSRGGDQRSKSTRRKVRKMADQRCLTPPTVQLGPKVLDPPPKVLDPPPTKGAYEIASTSTYVLSSSVLRTEERACVAQGEVKLGERSAEDPDAEPAQLPQPLNLIVERLYVRVPRPPVLRAADTVERQAQLLANWYAGGVQAVYGKRDWTVTRGAVTKNKNYKVLAAAAAFCVEHGVHVAGWVRTSFHVWDGMREGEVRTPPPVGWVFGRKRMEERAATDPGSSDDTLAVVYTPRGRAFLAQQVRLEVAFVRARPATGVAVAALIAHVWPSRAADLVALKEEVCAMQDDLSMRVATGSWVW